MVFSINFNNKHLLQANKISNVIANDMLSTKTARTRELS